MHFTRAQILIVASLSLTGTHGYAAPTPPPAKPSPSPVTVQLDPSDNKKVPAAAGTTKPKATGVDLSKFPGPRERQYVDQTTLTITVPDVETASDQIRAYAKKFESTESKVKNTKAERSSYNSEEDDLDDFEMDGDMEDGKSQSDTLEFTIPPQSTATFERLVERLSLSSFPVQKEHKNAPLYPYMKHTDHEVGNYVVEVHRVKFRKISASVSILTTSLDNTQYIGGAMGIHGENAAMGFVVGNLNGKDRKKIVFADISNYFRISPLSAARGQLMPVIGYDFGVMSIDHQSFGMLGMNIGPSYTNYKTYSITFLTRFAALLTQSDSKFSTMPGLEMRYFF